MEPGAEGLVGFENTESDDGYDEPDYCEYNGQCRHRDLKDQEDESDYESDYAADDVGYIDEAVELPVGHWTTAAWGNCWRRTRFL